MKKETKQKYNLSCINCDDVFTDIKEAEKHQKRHKKIFKANEMKVPTGFWRELLSFDVHP